MRFRGEQGAATVLAVAFLSVLVLVGAALGVVGAMVNAHRVAQAAADLAALSGAEAVGDGRSPCAAASRVATANGAAVTACVVAGREVHVEVSVTGPHWLGQEHDLVAEARAGP